ncbi:MAG: hypothetical protein JSC189_001034 [Candidatus Tokpelaia sp. JSC189]|nr:MAG: hypothetical protein JSC189_001034 [Candidatus Tokpelaia sp. JSC189]
MCDLSTAAIIGSTLLGTAGMIQQSRAQAQAANIHAQMAQMNARIASQRARDALERGALEERQKRQQVSGLMGRQRMAFAKNNVDMAFGSPLDSIIDTAVMGEMDALTIRSNAAREAYDHDVASANARAQSPFYKMEEKNARTAGWLGAGETLLGGGAKAYSSHKGLNPR